MDDLFLNKYYIFILKTEELAKKFPKYKHTSFCTNNK